MAANIIKIGLTGSIGMGKTTAGNMFRELGCPVFDADKTVHSIYNHCKSAIDSVGKLIPESVTSGKIDRQKLASIITANPDMLEKLESIVHPLVHEKRREFIKDAENKETAAVLFDIPLLFETGRQDEFDFVVVVSAPEEVQRMRVLKRPGMTKEKFELILSRQVPDSKKRQMADFVIDTGGKLEDTKKAVARIWKEIISTAKQKKSHA